MGYINPKYANEEGGIIVDYSDDPDLSLYVAEESDWDGVWARAVAGEFGPIAPYVPPPEPEPEPDPVIPQVVTRRQGRLALLEVGKLDDVEAAIAAIADPAERRAAEIEYEADTWERSNAFLQAMWAQLGGTETELDALFVLASEK